MTRDLRAELAAHLLFVVLAVVVAYDLFALWAPVLGGAS